MQQEVASDDVAEIARLIATERAVGCVVWRRHVVGSDAAACPPTAEAGPVEAPPAHLVPFGPADRPDAHSN